MPPRLQPSGITTTSEILPRLRACVPVSVTVSGHNNNNNNTVNKINWQSSTTNVLLSLLLVRGGVQARLKKAVFKMKSESSRPFFDSPVRRWPSLWPHKPTSASKFTIHSWELAWSRSRRGHNEAHNCLCVQLDTSHQSTKACDTAWEPAYKLTCTDGSGVGTPVSDRGLWVLGFCP